MADETILIDVEYNTDEAATEVDNLTISIEGMKVAQGMLAHELETGKKSQKEYSIESEKVRTKLQKEQKQRKDLIKIMQAEKGSRDKLKQIISQLIRERNALNTSTEKGAKKSDELRVKIDKLSKELKDNGTVIEKNKDSVGGYEEAIANATDGLGGMAGGIQGVIQQAKAFIASPIGVVFAALALAVAAVTDAFKRNEDSMNSVRKSAGKLRGAWSALRGDGKKLSTFFAKTFDTAIDISSDKFNTFAASVFVGLKKLGFNKAAESVENFAKKINEGADAGERLAAAENELVKAQRLAEKTQLDFQKLAERQRQIRDDEALAIDKRIAANKELGQILQTQLSEESKIANLALSVADQRIALEGESTANLDERAEALTRISDIQERVESQASEQLVNINTLQRENNELLKIQIRDKEALAAIDQKTAENEKALMEDLANFEKSIDLELAKESKELVEDLKAQEVENLAALEEQQTEDVKEEAGKRNQIISQSFDAAKQIAQEAGQFLLDLNQARFDADLRSLENQNLTEAEFNKKKINLERNFARKQKRTAIANALINGALAVTKAFAQLGPIAGGIAAALVTATTGLQIARITSQKFEKGGKVPLAKKGAKFGTFDGPSHTGGGTDIINGRTGQPIANVEKEENFYVVNKDASAYINSLSDINQRIGGGVPLSNKRSHMADGGQADIQNGSSAPTISDMTESVIKNLPPIIVQTADIKTGLEDRQNVIDVSVI